jgi:hypothetical protein
MMVIKICYDTRPLQFSTCTLKAPVYGGIASRASNEKIVQMTIAVHS